MKTRIEEVTENIKAWCASHIIINSFTTESVEKLQNVQYPIFWSNINGIDFNGGSVKLKFKMMILDKLQDDESDIDKIQSDTALIIEDFNTFLNGYSDSDFYISTDIEDVSPIADTVPDKVAGWRWDISIEVGSLRCTSHIPID